MKTLERFSKFFGLISVKEVGNQVKVTGIDGFIMSKQIAQIWQTNLINKHMFSSITDTSFSFNKFFIPDVVYLLIKMRTEYKTSWASKRTIDKIIQGFLTNTWYKKTAQEVVPIIDENRKNLLKWKPLEKQTEFLHLYGDRIPRYGLRGYILALGPGGGKSFSSLLTATCVIPPSVAEVKIIVSPKKAIRLVWEKTIINVFKKEPTYWVSDSNMKMPLKNTEYYVFHYEKLDQAIDLAQSLINRNVRFFVIVDESHNFSDIRSERTQRLIKLQTMADNTYFIWMSGTPILKLATEMITFLKCADPNFDQDAENRFKKIFSSAPGRSREIFNHRLGLMMAFLVPKKEINASKPTIKELPVKLPPALAKKFLLSTVREEMKEYIKQRLEFYKKEIKGYRDFVNKWLDNHERTISTREQKRLFKTYKKNLSVTTKAPDLSMRDLLLEMRIYERRYLFPSLPPDIRKTFRSNLSAIKNIKLKVRGEALGVVLGKRRSECAATLGIYCKPELLIKESLSKTIFFASSVLPIQVLSKYLIDKGFNPLLIYGATNKDLFKNIEQFTNDPDTNPLCATMQSLSESVPVIAASTIVLLNRPYRDALYQQIAGRIDRLDQPLPTTIIEVTLDTGDEPNVSSRTDDILREVRNIISDLIGPDFISYSEDEKIVQETIDNSKALIDERYQIKDM